MKLSLPPPGPQRRAAVPWARRAATVVLCAVPWIGAGCARPAPRPPDGGHATTRPDLGVPGGSALPFAFASARRLAGNDLPTGDETTLAHLVLRVTDGEGGPPIPARVIFRPPPGAGFDESIVAGTARPPSRTGGVGAVVGPGVLGAPEGVLLAGGEGVVPVPAGTYELFITRGPEYEAVVRTITAARGALIHVDAALDRSVDTRGWLAADLHVHTARSFDSHVSLERRVISLVSNGVEVLVPTDHNVVTDFGDAIERLGYGPELAGRVSGDEIGLKGGHVGAYPMPYDPSRPDGGSPPSLRFTGGRCPMPAGGTACFEPGDAFQQIRAAAPGAVITINHPWVDAGDLGFFTNYSWGAGTRGGFSRPLVVEGQFDAFELLSGYWLRADVRDYLVADWFYLLRRGHRVAALGGSDSHRLNWVRAGWPRSWLRLPTDRPGEVTGAMLAEAVRMQRVITSSGPFITLTVDGAGIGDTVVPRRAGQVTVGVTVDAPAWIDVTTVEIYVDGEKRRTVPVPPGARPRFRGSFVEPVRTDGYVVATTFGRTPLASDIVGEYRNPEDGEQPPPWAITNPVFIDADGDGAWRPPPQPLLDPPPEARRAPDPAAPRSPRTEEEAPIPPTERDLLPLLYPD